ncbi:MAG: MFS transporter [Acidimicrobiia bacterium]|nr:MFS transporter [Acidimicrobiia bacterium]
MRRRVLVSTTIGNALEWFDFIVFGLLASVIGKLFFPAGNPASSLLLIFATFGIAFVARPLGGLVFGLYADRFGRKRALVVMITLMAVGTGLIGFLPTSSAIGLWAPLLLLVGRLIQGFSAGGEFGGASAMLIEFAPPGQRGRYGAFQMVSQGIAFVLGAITATSLGTALSPEQVENWGWRIPFIVGILIGPTGYYLRKKCVESPEFQSYLQEKQQRANSRRETPLSDLFRHYPRELFAAFCVIAAGTASTYVTSVFLPPYAASELRLSLLDAQLGLLFVYLFFSILVVPIGALSDRIGRRPVLVLGLMLNSVLFFVLLRQLVAEPTQLHLWQLQATTLLLSVVGVTPAFMTEIFPVGVRSTGASLMYNLAVMLFGGLAPFTNTWLVQVTGDLAAPAYYIFFATVVGLVGLAVYRPQSGQGPTASTVNVRAEATTP